MTPLRFICIVCLCLALVSCATQSAGLYPATSPKLAKHLGIQDSDWHEIHSLVGREQGYSLLFVEHSRLGYVGAWMGTETADGIRETGPVFFYAKHQGHWYRLDEMSSWGDK